MGEPKETFKKDGINDEKNALSSPMIHLPHNLRFITLCKLPNLEGFCDKIPYNSPKNITLNSYLNFHWLITNTGEEPTGLSEIKADKGSCYWKPSGKGNVKNSIMKGWKKMTGLGQTESNLLMSMDIGEEIKAELYKGKEEGKKIVTTEMVGPYRGQAVINRVDGNDGNDENVIRMITFDTIQPRADDVVNVVEKDMGVGVSEEVDSAQTNQGSTNSQTDNNNNNQPGATTQTQKQVGR